MNDLEIRFTFEDGSEAIAHYGVMGMKWGIRHDPQKTGQKVAAQVAKHQTKADKYRAKANKKDSTLLGGSKTAKYAKYMAKAHKYTKKANRSDWHPLQSSHRRAVNQRKAEKYQKKAAGYANSVAKIEKYNAKANKYQYKADRLQNAYNKQLRKIERKNAKKGKAALARAM